MKVQMSVEAAKKRLKAFIQKDGGLYDLGWYLSYTPGSNDTATLDGYFTADDLEAIAVYMREHP